jgi:predicted RNA-binding Zn-ribbon protein involved in translation (DUF1610 family)
VSTELELEGTIHATCPHCGYQEHDSWEIGGGLEGDFETACNSCGEDFLVSRNVSVSYTTRLP